MLVIQTHGCAGGLLTEIEVSLNNTLGHIGQLGQISIAQRIIGRNGQHTGLAAGCRDLHGTNAAFSLFVIRIELVGGHLGHAAIGGHIDPVLIHGLLDLHRIFVIKLHRIDPNLGGLGNTGEGETDTHDLIVALCTQVKVVHIQCTLIPAASYGGQLHGQHIGELPLTTHYLDQVNLDLRRGIFKLEVSGQHTAGHIRQLGHLRIAQHHLGI